MIRARKQVRGATKCFGYTFNLSSLISETFSGMGSDTALGTRSISLRFFQNVSIVLKLHDRRTFKDVDGVNRRARLPRNVLLLLVIAGF